MNDPVHITLTAREAVLIRTILNTTIIGDYGGLRGDLTRLGRKLRNQGVPALNRSDILEDPTVLLKMRNDIPYTPAPQPKDNFDAWIRDGMPDLLFHGREDA